MNPGQIETEEDVSSMQNSELETNVTFTPKLNGKQSADPLGANRRVGIFVRDAANRRLIESLLLQLKLIPETMADDPVDADVLSDLELIVADEAIARNVLYTLRGEVTQPEESHPALIAVRTAGTVLPSSANGVGSEQDFDGILTLPQEPSTLLAHLGIILYAHRAYTRRYQTAMEDMRLSRRIFRSATNSITVASATLPDMPLVYVNPAFEVMTGYSLEEVRGRNCRFLQGKDADQPGRTQIREALTSNHGVSAVLKNYRKNGTSFWNELSLSPIRDRDGLLTHIVGIQMDVSARVEFEAALRESEKLAAVGRLAASIAHEINNPLEAVMNLLYLAQHTDEMGEVKGYLSQAEGELQRVSAITSQSLRFYKQSTNPRAISPFDMLESVLDLYKNKLNSTHISVEKRDRPSEPLMCMESEIRQVLSNLIRNAIDAMHDAGGRLIIRSRAATEWRSGAKGVLMTVADTGSGMSTHTMEHLYTAFFTTKGPEGTGLGLWVSSEIIDRHHGRLRVRSSQRGGKSWTVFELFLPS